MIDDWRQFPLRGHVLFCRQLHVLLSVVLLAVSSVRLDEFKMCLL